MIFIVKCHVFPLDVMFIIKETNESVTKELDKYGLQCKEILKTTKAKTVRLEGGQIIVRFNVLTHGFVAHEIYHAAYLMLGYIGVKPCNKSDEIYAYLIGYLTDEFYKKVKIK